MKSDKNFGFKKLINLFFNLLGKKNKKSFSSIINHVTETYENEGLISFEEKNVSQYG